MKNQLLEKNIADTISFDFIFVKYDYTHFIDQQHQNLDFSGFLLSPIFIIRLFHQPLINTTQIGLLYYLETLIIERQ